MLVIIGYLVVVLSVFGGYAMSGGNLHALFQPFELIIIGGAAIGSFIIANNKKVIVATLKSIVICVKGPNYTRAFFIELLSLFFDLLSKIRKDGILSIEAEVADYKKSPLFSRYKLVVKEDKIMEFLCDHLKLIITNRVEPMQLEQLMDEDIETFSQELELPIAAINKVSDSFPAFGIVAAVMGVVTTMQHISGSPEELGKHVAAALVGTFLGVLLGYGFTSPIAAVLENRRQAEIVILQSIKVALLASVHNLAPSIAVEFARKLLYSSERPTSVELEKILQDARSNRGKEEPSQPEQK